jgi:protocatechuate 3,4-dioxygenase beta subunit
MPAQIDLRRTELSSRNRVYLWRQAAISGTVTDDAGEPVARLGVRLLRKLEISSYLRFADSGVAATDDRGVYRFSDLSPGTYVVAARSRTGETRALTGGATVYYPGTRVASQAVEIPVAQGEERWGVDLRLPPTIGARQLSGRITGAGSTTSLTVRLQPLDSREHAVGIDVRETKSGASGQFAFDSVPEGQYIVYVATLPAVGSRDGNARGGVIYAPPVLQPTSVAPTTWGEVLVTIGDRDVDGIVLPLHQAGRISGRLVFSGSAAAPVLGDPPHGFVIVSPADGRDLGAIPLARVEPDGRFHTVGLPPGKYEISPWTRYTNWQGWSVRSIQVQGRELAGLPITLGSTDLRDILITLTDRPTEITGTVRDGRGNPVTNATIYYRAVDRRQRYPLQWGAARIGLAWSGAEGQYRAVGLLPGEYLFTAVGGALQDWTALNGIDDQGSRTVTVQLTDGESRRLDLVPQPPGERLLWLHRRAFRWFPLEHRRCAHPPLQQTLTEGASSRAAATRTAASAWR